jgi:hypothetical protein
MNATDGLILFAACVVSFTLGYIIGVVRVCRFVSKRLTEVKESMVNIEKYSSELRQIYARLSNEDKTE